MKVLDRITDVRGQLDAYRARGVTVGFVPTMGALHHGHMSLVRRARRECGVVVVSIFVNPAQFGPGEDLASYPRPLDDDLRACREAGVDVAFCPTAEEMYPTAPATAVVVSGLTASMEGAHRPGHFDGVTLVVTKLLNAVGPCRAYFGEKDAQQLRVVRRMVADLNIPAEIVGCATARDPDGLAASSRNAYLSAHERSRALAFPRALHEIARRVDAGERDVAALLDACRSVLAEGSPDAVDYLQIVDPGTLEPLRSVEGPALVCGAIRIGRTRLIDNVMVGVEALARPPGDAAVGQREGGT